MASKGCGFKIKISSCSENGGKRNIVYSRMHRKDMDSFENKTFENCAKNSESETIILRALANQFSRTLLLNIFLFKYQSDSRTHIFQ